MEENVEVEQQANTKKKETMNMSESKIYVHACQIHRCFKIIAH